MSLPKEQLTALRECAEAHQRRITDLREWIRVAEEEIRLHELLRDFIRNDRVVAVLGRFFDDSKLLVEFAGDPLRYSREEGVTLPEGLTLNGAEATEDPAPRVTAYLTYGAWNVEAIWDREGGFYARPRRGRVGSGNLDLVIPR